MDALDVDALDVHALDVDALDVDALDVDALDVYALDVYACIQLQWLRAVGWTALEPQSQASSLASFPDHCTSRYSLSIM